MGDREAGRVWNEGREDEEGGIGRLGRRGFIAASRGNLLRAGASGLRTHPRAFYGRS